MSMAWVAVGTAVVGAGTQAYSSGQAQKSANRTAIGQSQAAMRYNQGQSLTAGGVLSSTNYGSPAMAQFLTDNPDVQAEFDRQRAAGWTKGMGFDQWLQAAVAASPELAARMSKYTVNTILPAWAKLDGKMAEQGIYDRLIDASGQPVAELPQSVKDMIAGSYKTGQGIYNGDTLSTELNALDPVLQSRTELAALEEARNRELRAKYGDINTTELAGLKDIYDTRTGGADAIYNTAVSGLKGIYDTEMTNADIYGQSSLQALNKALSQQEAERARQGFVGGGSGNALLKARTLAEGYNKGAEARGTAALNLSTGEAQAGNSNALRLDQIGTEYAAGKANANLSNVQRLAQILDTDAARAKIAAKLQNNTDTYNVKQNDVNRRLANVGLAGQLYGQEAQIKSLQDSLRYQPTVNLFNALSTVAPRTAAPSYQYVMPNITPVISGGQIAGGALSALGQSLGSYYSNKSLMDALKSNQGTSYNYWNGGTVPANANSPR